jgi:hypothetical protein
MKLWLDRRIAPNSAESVALQASSQLRMVG